MKYLILIPCIILFTNACGQADTFANIVFLRELQQFVDTIEFNSKAKKKYAVYAVNFFHIDTVRNELCFTIGYILNDYELKTVSPDYVYYFNERPILIRGKDMAGINIFKTLNLRKIEKKDSVNIKKRLASSEEGLSFTYIPEGLMFCKEGEKQTSTYYENADEIPLEKSIYGNFPQGFQIKMLKNGDE